MGIFAELLCGTGGRMMMKLAYERPIMRAEAFATNAYCGSCKRTPKWDGILSGVLNGIKYLFDSATRTDMINQVTGAQQYYYIGHNENEKDTNTYFLEYCATAQPGSDFFLYQDLANSGYCKTEGAHWPWEHESDKSGVGTLEVARGTGWSGWHTSNKTGLDWYADKNLGNITYDKEIEYTQS